MDPTQKVTFADLEFILVFILFSVIATRFAQIMTKFAQNDI